ncbi:MAG: hypothetical protein ABIV48_06990, partial [Pyrinomonadaceae bacterium]
MNRREFGITLLAALPAISISGQQQPLQSRVNGVRLNAHLTELAQFGKTPEGGTNRVAYSEMDVQARNYA